MALNAHATLRATLWSVFVLLILAITMLIFMVVVHHADVERGLRRPINQQAPGCITCPSCGTHLKLIQHN